MSQERFLKVVDGNAILVNIYGNKIRTYYSKNVIRVDWYSEKEESVLIQLFTGKRVIISKYGNLVRTI